MQTDLEERGQGLRAFFSICDKWCCTQDEAQVLLGISSSVIFQKSRRHPAQLKLTGDMAERIVCIMKIHGALILLFLDDDPILIPEWVRAKKSDPLFQQQSPMQKMLGGTLKDLTEVHEYLLTILGLEELIDANS